MLIKLEPPHLTLDNLKSKDGQDSYSDTIKNVQDKESSSYQM